MYLIFLLYKQATYEKNIYLFKISVLLFFDCTDII